MSSSSRLRLSATSVSRNAYISSMWPVSASRSAASITGSSERAMQFTQNRKIGWSSSGMPSIWQKISTGSG